MTVRPDWFDATEIAMVDAAQQSGELASVLRRLAERHQQAEALTQKLIGALAYPAIVTVVAIGVVIFMSTRTLPQLAGLLEEQDIAVPTLTRAVMGAGQWLAGHWLVIVSLLVVLPLVTALFRIVFDRRLRWFAQRVGYDRLVRRCQPHLVRRITVAGFCSRLAELLRTGIPLVEALRIVTPTVNRRSFQKHLFAAADAIERGSEPSEALSDGHWLDAEFQRLVEMGQHTGELDALLQRLADRYQRQAQRLIERLARVLEPAVIVLLAALVGLVVMAAVLPLVRLQEMI